MSKNWKDKGWNNMESILDKAMPVQRRPLLPPVPVQLRVATFVLLIIGIAYWGINLMNSGNNLNTLNAFELATSQEFSQSEFKSEQLKFTAPSTSKLLASAAEFPASKKENISSFPAVTSNRAENKIQQSAQSSTLENLEHTNIEEVFGESITSRDITGSAPLDNVNADNNTASNSSLVTASAEVIESNDVPSPENEHVSIEVKADQSENVLSEASPIVNPKLNTSFSIGASAGNYTFSAPTLYGQLQLNMHIPVSKSINLTVLAAAGKGLLYQNTEVLLAEYSNNPANGTVLGSEAPGDDLSAYVDVKSLTNILAGTQILWQFSNKWSLALGANAAYLFDIQHQAIQSTSLVPQGQSPQQIFTPSEITEKFAHWNQWDLRMNASLQFHMTGNWSLAMSYNRGLTNLLKHPISSEHNIQMNSLSLGLNYRF